MELAAGATETIASRGAAGCRGYQEDGLPKQEAPGGGLAGSDKPPFLLPLENPSICTSKNLLLSKSPSWLSVHYPTVPNLWEPKV